MNNFEMENRQATADFSEREKQECLDNWWDTPYDEWDDGKITKNDLTIYWVDEDGKEKEGRAGFNCSDNGSYITYEDNDYPGIVFDSIYANELPGDELQLLRIWDDMVSEAESSEDGRLNVTNVPLKDR